MTFLNRFQRHASLTGGPLDGESRPVAIPKAHPWPPYLCAAVGRGPWLHYTHDGDDRYRYVDTCADVVHDGPAPHEYRCCCGREDGHG